MATVSYVVTEGDRWDLIAWKAYGDTDRTADIIEANPDVFITERLEAGIVLQIPVIAESAAETDTSLLPPWKQ